MRHGIKCIGEVEYNVYVLHNVLVTFVIEMESFKVTKSCVSPLKSKAEAVAQVFEDSDVF